jgi:hypothetical protein
MSPTVFIIARTEYYFGGVSTTHLGYKTSREEAERYVADRKERDKKYQHAGFDYDIFEVEPI